MYSVHTLTVTINNSSVGSSSVTACDTYTWEGQTITSSGDLTHTYTNASGCDSVHTLTVTINNSSVGSSSVTACDTHMGRSDYYFIWRFNILILTLQVVIVFIH